MKKLIIFLIVILFFLGTSPYYELNNLAVVDVMGLEFKDNKYFLYLNIINEDNKVYTIDGNSLGEVFLKAKDIDNKKTYYDHLEVVIFNTNILNNNDKVINFFKDEFTSIDYLVLSYDGNISNLFNKYHKRSDYKSFIKKDKSNEGSIINVSFKDYLSSSLDDIKSSNIPLIDYNDKLISKGIYLPDINHIVDTNLSRSSYLLNGNIDSYSSTIKIDNNYYEVFLSNLKVDINYDNKKLIIDITSNIDSPDSNNLSKIKNIVKEDISNSINKLINDEKSLNYNISNLINYVYFKDKKNYSKSYKESNVVININLKERSVNNYD